MSWKRLPGQVAEPVALIPTGLVCVTTGATATWGRNKNCSQRHAKVERSMNFMRRGVTKPEV